MVVRQRSLNANKTICLVIVTVAIGYCNLPDTLYHTPEKFFDNPNHPDKTSEPPKIKKVPIWAGGRQGWQRRWRQWWWRYLLKISSEPIQSLYYRASVKRDWFPDLLVAETSQNKFWVRENFSQNYFLLQESSAQWNQSSSFWTPYFSGKCSTPKSS